MRNSRDVSGIVSSWRLNGVVLERALGCVFPLRKFLRRFNPRTKLPPPPPPTIRTALPLPTHPCTDWRFLFGCFFFIAASPSSVLDVVLHCYQ